MNIARHDRTLIAWTLYACVLFSLFACGIHHGQMSGLALSGLGSGFCSESRDGAASHDLGDGQHDAQFDAMSCPLCSSSGLAAALGSAPLLAALPADASSAPLELPNRAQPPPREAWPSLNPRASPRLDA
ncbi:DUF2946 domain-containing protein [Pseudomonas sp. LRF_L74]|uniref:DUF2946 domain-containing protein n=1 Tax=Pseudomonas sp. LRF_L74 TaxID=3369422 RepID=UPI003F5FFC38